MRMEKQGEEAKFHLIQIHIAGSIFVNLTEACLDVTHVGEKLSLLRSLLAWRTLTITSMSFSESSD